MIGLPKASFLAIPIVIFPVLDFMFWNLTVSPLLLKHSGGSITDFDSNEILYGKKDFKNPSLILKSKNLI